MATKTTASLTLFLVLNLLVFSLTTASPTPQAQPPSPSMGSCPIDALKLGVCANLLGGLGPIIIGTPPKTPCCTVIQGLADLEAAVCLCTAIRAKILGINLNVRVVLSSILNNCGKNVPSGFICT